MRGLLLVAFVGAAFSLQAANPPQGDNRDSARANADKPPVRVAVTQFPTTVDQGCNKGEKKRQSDLCAQWESADAAQDAANYSLVAAIIGVVGTAFLILTFREQRRTSRAELRAYVSVRIARMPDIEHAVLPFSVDLEYENTGSTPANRLSVDAAWVASDKPPTKEFFEETLK